MKRYLRAIIIILAALVIVGAGYYFLRPDDSPNQQPKPEPEQTMEVFLERSVVSPALSFSGETLWFFDDFGRLFSKPIFEEGEAEEFHLPAMSANGPGSIQGLVQAYWQTSGDNFIVEQNLDGHSAYQAYDPRKREFIAYPKELRQPRFIAGSSRIVYDWAREDGQHELQTSDLTSQNFERVVELFRPDYRITASPAKEEVALFTEDRNNPTELYLVGLDDGEFIALAEAGTYEGVRFSPDGSLLVFSRWVSEQAALPALYLHDLATRTTVPLNISASINQVAWDGNGRVLIGSVAGIIEYDVVSNKQRLIYQFPASASLIRPVELLVHPDQPLLFFVNQETGYLHRVDLEVR